MKQQTKEALSSLDAMWAALDRVKEKHCGKVEAIKPEDSFTVEEFSDRYGYSRSHSARILVQLTEQGTLAKLRAYMPNADGRLIIKSVYKVNS